jgi:hypothetical protein
MAGNDVRDALTDMIFGLKDTFKKYTRSTRRQAWNSLMSHAGKEQVEKLIMSPTRPVRGIAKLRFKEWIESQDL